MNPQDENSNYVDPSSVPIMPTITRYGMIGGLIMAVLSLVGILGGFTNPANWALSLMFTVVVLAVYIGLMVVAIKSDRDGNLGGYITFGRAFLIAFGVGAIAALFGLLINIVYMGFINPDYMAEVAEGSREMYENFGMSEDQIDEAIAKASEGMSLGGLVLSQFLGYLGGAVVGAIISLIVAAVTKKDAPGLA